APPLRWRATRGIHRSLVARASNRAIWRKILQTNGPAHRPFPETSAHGVGRSFQHRRRLRGEWKNALTFSSFPLGYIVATSRVASTGAIVTKLSATEIASQGSRSPITTR